MSNPTDHAVILAAFDALLPQLPITADGLDREQMTLGALEIAARLVADVKALRPEGFTPEDMLRYRLAALTGDLLTTAVLEPDPRVVRDWLIARAELAQVRLGSH